MKRILSLMLVICLLTACKQEKSKPENVNSKTILPSFNEGATKQAIIDFVTEVTDKKNVNYVVPEERIACFDNDGTLWAEQPLPNQIFFTFDRIKKLSETQPELKTTQPYKAVIENDMETIKGFKVEDLLKLVGKANEAIDFDQYDKTVLDWINTAEHPVLKRPIRSTVYQPMLELMDYLRDNGFKVYIVSGGSVEFMRAFAQELYKVPTENVIGSRLKTTATKEGDSIKVERTSEFEFNDDREGKVVSIQEFIGKKPIMVVGNSDGDLAMMEYAMRQDGKTLLAYVFHDDAEREFLYDDKTLYGTLKEGKEIADKNHWLYIDIKNDWKTVFPNP